MGLKRGGLLKPSPPHQFWLDRLLGEVQLFLPCKNNSLKNPAGRQNAGFDPPKGLPGHAQVQKNLDNKTRTNLWAHLQTLDCSFLMGSLSNFQSDSTLKSMFLKVMSWCSEFRMMPDAKRDDHLGCDDHLVCADYLVLHRNLWASLWYLCM